MLVVVVFLSGKGWRGYYHFRLGYKIKPAIIINIIKILISEDIA